LPPPSSTSPPIYNPDPYHDPNLSPEEQANLEEMIAAWIAALEAEKNAEDSEKA
jgi:hypothetical protein